MTEDQLQASFWTWAWQTYPQHRRQMWAVPNGLRLSGYNANLAKSTGLLSGVWDMHCFHLGKFHIIEAKIGNNQLTTDRIVKGKKVFGQKEWGELMAQHGATRHIYRTLEEGQIIFQQIFSLTSNYGRK